MNKFVVLSFVFLALGFYELSGGASFDPDGTRSAIVEARVEREAERRVGLPALPAPAQAQTAAAPEPASATAPTDDATTRTALNLVTFEAAARPQASEPVVSEPRGLTDFVDDEPAPVSLSDLQANAAQSRPIAFPGSTTRTGPLPASDNADIRIVTGTLVNVRSGPGTDYDIVDQLEQSTQVIVLSDTGNGWVEFQPLDGGTTGWIAAFLLTGG